MNIREKIRQVVSDTDLSDPHLIASRLIADLTPEEKDAALAEALPDLVRELLRQARLQAGSAAVPNSSKVEAIRAWHARVLAQAVDVSGGKGEWKRLSECTRDEILNIAQYRRTVAARNIATAEQYEWLATQMQAKGVAKVADLAPAVVVSAFGKAAA